MTSLDEALRQAAEAAKPSQEPHGWLSAEGDSVFWFRSHDDYFADRINELVTVFRSMETKQPIGVQIKMVTALAADPLIRSMLDDNKLDIVALVMATYHVVPDGRGIFSFMRSRKDARKREELRAERYRELLYSLHDTGRGLVSSR